MSPGPLDAVLRRIHQVIGRCDGGEDGLLLAHFADKRDEAAFEAIVRRHGPLVLAAGRRVLPDANDAEDVFQATFLVLARKAGSIRSTHSLGAWLHRTATRLALALREEAVRRRQGEREAVLMQTIDPSAEAAWREVGPILDAELSRLPDKYRLPVVLCCLEEKTHDEAARELGWPRGTVAGRLSRAREVLRARLTRRGLTLTAATLSVVLAEKTARAAVPAALVRSTVQIAAAFAGGAGAAIAGKGAMLAQGALKGALATKVKVGTSLVLAVGLTVAATVGLAGMQPPAPATPPAPAAPPTASPAAPSRPEEKKPAHADLLGDPLPDGAETRLGTVRLRHPNIVLFTAFTPDGKTVWADDVDGEGGLRLWDVETGRQQARIALGTWTGTVAMTPDCMKAVVCGRGERDMPPGVFLLWDVKTDKEVRRFGKPDHPGPHALAISPDGKTLASSPADPDRKAHDIALWDADSGRELRRLEGHMKEVRALRFTPDGKGLVSAGDDHAVRVWGVEDGKLQFEVSQGPGDGWKGIALSPDGKTLAVEEDEGVIRLLELSGGKERRRISSSPGGPFRFTPDSRFLVKARDAEFVFWDAETGKEARRFPGTEGRPQSITFSPDGRTIATPCLDHSVHLWDVKTGKERTTYNGHSGAVVVAFAPDGRTAATAAGDGAVRLWDPRSGEERRLLRDHKEDVLCVAFSPDGKLLATGGGQLYGEGKDIAIRLWDTETCKVVRRMEGHEGGVRTLAFSPDGRLLASGGGDIYAAHPNHLRLWDVRTGEFLRRCEPSNEAFAVAFSPDGATVAAAGMGYSVRLWNTADAKLLHEMSERNLHLNTFRCLAFAPDGITVVAGLGDDGLLNKEDDALRVWDASTGASLHPWPLLHDAVSVLAFSRDGKTLALGCQDNSVALIETLTGREAHRYKGHEGTVRGLAFAPDGQTLLSGSKDGTALVWDLTGRRENGRLPPADLTAKQLNARWDDLADPDPARARPALWELVAGEEASVRFLAERLMPASAPPPARLARLLADLNDDDLEVRDRASTELDRLGEGAAAALRKALEGDPPAEVRRRLEQALEGMTGATPNGRQARLLRAVEVLEHVGLPSARALLKKLANGAPGARLTREAKAALERASS